MVSAERWVHTRAGWTAAALLPSSGLASCKVVDALVRCVARVSLDPAVADVHDCLELVDCFDHLTVGDRFAVGCLEPTLAPPMYPFGHRIDAVLGVRDDGHLFVAASMRAAKRFGNR
jgi:hypothetical protein